MVFATQNASPTGEKFLARVSADREGARPILNERTESHTSYAHPENTYRCTAL